MRALVPALAFVLTATLAFAETIAPPDAPAHVGQNVTVEGVVAEVHPDARSGTTFIDLGARWPHQLFTGVIFKNDVSKF